MVTLGTIRGCAGSKKKVLSEEHWLLPKMFADKLISENQLLHSVYIALYRVSKYLKYLEGKGKSIIQG